MAFVATLKVKTPGIIQMCEQLMDNIVKSHGEGVCFIFDGLDEYQPQDKSKSVVYRLLHKRYLCKAMIIVTSRPIASIPFRGRCSLTRQIEILGFYREQIFEYLNTFPFISDKSESSRVKLRKYLCSHPNILHMCYLPVHAAMICFLYEQGNGDIPPTQTKIYEELTRCIILRMLTHKNEDAILTSLRELRGEDKTNFDEICHLAFDMTRNSKQAVCSKEIPFLQHIGLNDAPFLGLITIDRTAKRYGRDNTYSFLHLTSQEYLAAWYIAHLEEKEQVKIIKLMANEGHMQMVWKFYCGMVKFRNKPTQVKLIMEKIDQVGPYHILNGIHCAFESQQKVICDYFMNVLLLNNVTLTPADLTAIGYVISTSSYSFKFILLCQCGLEDEHIKAFLMEGSSIKLKNIEILLLSGNNIGSDGVVALSRALGDKLNCISLSQNNIGLDGAVALAHALKSSEKLESLDFSYNNIGSDGAAEVARALGGRLMALDLAHNNIGSDGAAAVARALGGRLTALGLAHNNIGPVGAVTVAHAVGGRLKTLDLAGINIDPDCAIDVGRTFRSCDKLMVLIFSRNNIGPDGARALVHEFQSWNKLTGLNLSRNNIGPSGALALAHALKHCNILKIMDISYNNIGPDGAVFLAHALKYCDELVVMHLSDNNIGPAGATAITHAVRSCDKLLQLDLSRNNIGPDGALKYSDNLVTLNLSQNNIGQDAQALINALKSCDKLKRLDISFNNIGPDGALALAGALKYCDKLNLLNVSLNNIGPDGALALAHALKSCDELMILDFTHNSIGPDNTNALALAFKKLKNLMVLYLGDNNIGPDGAQALTQALESCQVELTDHNLGPDNVQDVAAFTTCFNDLSYVSGGQNISNSFLALAYCNPNLCDFVNFSVGQYISGHVPQAHNKRRIGTHFTDSNLQDMIAHAPKDSIYDLFNFILGQYISQNVPQALNKRRIGTHFTDNDTQVIAQAPKSLNVSFGRYISQHVPQARNNQRIRSHFTDNDTQVIAHAPKSIDKVSFFPFFFLSFFFFFYYNCIHVSEDFHLLFFYYSNYLPNELLLTLK